MEFYREIIRKIKPTLEIEQISPLYYKSLDIDTRTHIFSNLIDDIGHTSIHELESLG